MYREGLHKEDIRSKLSKDFAVPPQALACWAQHVHDQIDASLDNLPEPSHAPLGPAHAPVYGPREKAAMQGLLSRYICIPVDKLSNNMFLACKCVMAEAQVTEIDGGLADQEPTFQQTASTPQDIIAAAQAMLQDTQLKSGASRLPFQYPIVKLHKQPQLAFRFITACSSFHLQHAAFWVTQLMRSVEGDVGRIWKGIKFPSNCGSRMWMSTQLNSAHSFDCQIQHIPQP